MQRLNIAHIELFLNIPMIQVCFLTNYSGSWQKLFYHMYDCNDSCTQTWALPWSSFDRAFSHLNHQFIGTSCCYHLSNFEFNRWGMATGCFGFCIGNSGPVHHQNHCKFSYSPRPLINITLLFVVPPKFLIASTITLLSLVLEP